MPRFLSHFSDIFSGKCALEGETRGEIKNMKSSSAATLICSECVSAVPCFMTFLLLFPHVYSQHLLKRGRDGEMLVMKD